MVDLSVKHFLTFGYVLWRKQLVFRLCEILWFTNGVLHPETLCNLREALQLTLAGKPHFFHIGFNYRL